MVAGQVLFIKLHHELIVKRVGFLTVSTSETVRLLQSQSRILAERSRENVLKGRNNGVKKIRAIDGLSSMTRFSKDEMSS